MPPRLLAELAATGQVYDQQAAQRAGRFLNLTPDTGPFLALLLQATRARTVLEVGTSNGYSTIWLTDAVQPGGGHVTTHEASAAKVALAAANSSCFWMPPPIAGCSCCAPTTTAPPGPPWRFWPPMGPTISSRPPTRKRP